MRAAFDSMGIEGRRARSHTHGRRHGRTTVHVLIVTMALVAAAFATYYPRSSNAQTTVRVPDFALSGIAATGSNVAVNFLQPPAQLETRASIALTGEATGTSDVRSVGAISQTTSFTSGVNAAVVASGEIGAGVKPLADIVDPSEPFILYETRPNDTVELVAERHGIAVQTLLDNNPEISNRDLLGVGQQLLVPRSDGIMHKVAHGETVASIVGQYDNISTETVVTYRPNGLIADDSLEAGQYLLLIGATLKPPPPPPPVVVAPAPGSGSPAGGSPGGGGGGAPPASGGGRFGYPLPSWRAVTDAFGTPRGGSSFHTGIDLDVPNDGSTPIFSACNGTVIRADYLTYSYGYHVVVDCGDGFTTLYAHMSQIHVTVGQGVGRGTQLGFTGNTGFSTGDHLHFEIRLNGQYLNPADYLAF